MNICPKLEEFKVPLKVSNFHPCKNLAKRSETSIFTNCTQTLARWSVSRLLELSRLWNCHTQKRDRASSIPSLPPTPVSAGGRTLSCSQRGTELARHSNWGMEGQLSCNYWSQALCVQMEPGTCSGGKMGAGGLTALGLSLTGMQWPKPCPLSSPAGPSLRGWAEDLAYSCAATRLNKGCAHLGHAVKGNESRERKVS